MENLIKLLQAATMLLLFITTVSFGQNNISELEYGAYLTNSKNLWKSAIEKRENIYEKSNNLDDLFSLISTQQALLNATMADKDEALFDDYIDDTEDNIDVLLDKNHKTPEIKALLSSCYGATMAYSPWKGIYLGSKSSGLMQEALKANQSSSLVWQLYANSKLFTPENYGGDKNEAIKAYLKAIELYETQSSNLKNNWRYLDALAWLGQAYYKTNQKDKAIATYEKALKQEPDFKWVKNALLPQAKK